MPVHPFSKKIWLERVEDLLAKRWVGGFLCLVVAVVYSWAYLKHPLFPTGAAEARQGWWSWYDQFTLWKSAAELAHLKITPENFHYPLGYPLLGAIFWWLMPAHAFFVPDLLLVLGITYVWWRLARRWLTRLQTLLVITLFVTTHTQLLALTVVIPWSTIATHFTLLSGIWFLVATKGSRTVWVLSGFAAVTYLVRPADALCFAPLLIWAVLRLPSWRERIKAGLGGMAFLGVIVFAVACLNRVVFGPAGSPYDRVVWDTLGFGAYRLDQKLFSFFIDGRPFYGEADTALLFRYPWMFLIFPGIFFWVQREKIPAIAALAAVAINWMLYFNFNDFPPSAIFRYSLIHYLAWAFVPLFTVSFAALLRGWHERSVQIGCLLSVCFLILALGLQIEERVLPAVVSVGRVEQLPTQRPLWVNFRGVPLEKVSQLRLDGREMREAPDYQIPYVPADLRLLLSARATGNVLSAIDGADIKATPRVGDYEWRWRFEPSRLKL